MAVESDNQFILIGGDMMKLLVKGILLLSICLIIFIACSTENGSNGSLPSDPNNWVCQDSLIPSSQMEINEWCEMNLNDLGEPAPEYLRNPPPLSMLDEKNNYDLDFQTFIRDRLYDTELGWKSDKTWRMTGPWGGDFGSDGENLTTHNAIKMYYSPEVVEWLCNDRQGEIPDGAMIIKEIHGIDEDLDITLDDQCCMVINATDIEPDLWTPSVKQSGASFDVWYWSIIYNNIDKFIIGAPTLLLGNPPIFDRSGIVNDIFYDVVGDPPLLPDPYWYPTGAILTTHTKIPNIVEPSNAYGQTFCITCHSTAEKEYIFSSLDNILGNSIRYKHFGIETGESSTSPGYRYMSRSTMETQTAVRNDEGFSLTSPLLEPTLAFLRFYDQLEGLNFSNAWDLRLPAQTYDHEVSSSDGPEQFLTADQCQYCHFSTILLPSLLPNMAIEVVGDGTTEIVNLSPYGEQNVSPMGLAGRDPIFFSQLQSETNNLPEFTTCIETTCLHCHGVMGQRQLAIDTEGQDTEGCEQLFVIAPPSQVPFGKPFALDMVTQWPNSTDNEFQEYGARARDGISCTVCHHIADTDQGLEDTFTGNFVTGPADEIYGPYEQVSVKPMQQATGITPRLGSQVSNSDLCGSCHNILLPVFTNEGEITGYSYEQTTGLEYDNSVFAMTGTESQSCQDCHMPTHFDGKELTFEIASIESNMFPPTTNRLPDSEITLTERSPYVRHTLHGLNLFINQIFQQFPLMLGYAQLVGLPAVPQTPSLITGQASMIEMAQRQVATVNIKELSINQDGELEAVVEVTNLTGHNLPSGVGFRRVFIEFLVRDSDGNVLWASGRTNKLGAIVHGTTDIVLPSEQPVKFPAIPFQPHYQTITRQDQVQIYQELIKDSAGDLTTSFLRRVTKVKGNSIRPRGYDPEYFAMQSSPYIQALAVTDGQAAFDPYYTDPELTGADVITYLVSPDEVPLGEIHDVKVTLFNQSIPPFYLQQRFRDASRGPADKDEINRLYYITSHLDVEEVEDDEGRQVLDEWKFFITSDAKTLRYKHIRPNKSIFFP